MREADPQAFEPDTSVLDAMQAWGAPAEEIDQVREQLQTRAQQASEHAQAFEVHADNMATVGAFIALRTQWQYAGMGAQRVGLNYSGVCAWLAQHTPRPRKRRLLMQGIQIMEHAVLHADQEKQQAEE